MINILRVELRRLFTGRNFKITIAIGFAIVLFHCLLDIGFSPNMGLENYIKYDLYPISVFNRWIGLDQSSVFSSVYFTIFPILAVYSYADSFFIDLKTGYVKTIFIKVEKKHYALAKYITVFLSGGIAVTFPLVLDLLICMSVLPSLPPEATSGIFNLFATNMWSTIFLHTPYLYVLLYIIINFLFGGVLAALCLAVSFVVTNHYMVLLTPFVLHIVLLAIFGNSHKAVAFYYILNPVQSIPASFPIIVIEFILLLIFPLSVFYYKVANDDVF